MRRTFSAIAVDASMVSPTAPAVSVFKLIIEVLPLDPKPSVRCSHREVKAVPPDG
jgi:hypothetical protein